MAQRRFKVFWCRVCGEWEVVDTHVNPNSGRAVLFQHEVKAAAIKQAAALEAEYVKQEKPTARDLVHKHMHDRRWKLLP